MITQCHRNHWRRYTSQGRIITTRLDDFRYLATKEYIKVGQPMAFVFK
jgi:hypothetical protein